MQAVILAAGIGSRLTPITYEKPKCMVRVGGKPILDHQIHAYAVAGIKDVIIIAGYKIEMIKKYCEKIKEVNIKIIENKDYKTTNNMYSLYLAKEEIAGSDFLLSNGDVICDKEIIKKAIDNEGKSLAFYDSGNFNEEELKLKIKDNLAYSIEAKGPKKDDVNGSTIGIFTLNVNASRYLFNDAKKVIKEKQLKNEWFEFSLNNVFKETKFIPVDIKGLSWVEIDDYEDLLLADKLFS